MVSQLASGVAGIQPRRSVLKPVSLTAPVWSTILQRAAIDLYFNGKCFGGEQPSHATVIPRTDK